MQLFSGDAKNAKWIFANKSLCAGMQILAWFLFRGNTTHIYDFRILLDFLGIKDLKKNKKGQFFFQRPQTRPKLHLLKFCNFFALCGPF